MVLSVLRPIILSDCNKLEHDEDDEDDEDDAEDSQALKICDDENPGGDESKALQEDEWSDEENMREGRVGFTVSTNPLRVEEFSR